MSSSGTSPTREAGGKTGSAARAAAADRQKHKATATYFMKSLVLTAAQSLNSDCRRPASYRDLGTMPPMTARKRADPTLSSLANRKRSHFPQGKVEPAALGQQVRRSGDHAVDAVMDKPGR